MIQTKDRATKIVERVKTTDAIVQKSDAYLSKAETYAERMAQTKLTNAQVKGLQTLAYTTDKVSDIVDWIKIRIGRDDKSDRWTKDNIGADLLKVLYEELRQDAKEIVEKLQEKSNLPVDAERQIHLRLIREYLKHVSAHFEFKKIGGES